MSANLFNTKANLGTAPVFFTAISTILGAIMFLRFGYAVGHLSFWGVLGIIMIAHMVTIPTALALAEIATNQKVEGGGEYFIISRSFGINIGAAIGIALYLSQAISVAFYVIAFAEAFEPVIVYVGDRFEINLTKRMFSLPMMGIITYMMLTRGVAIGVKALYVVVPILVIALVLFFLGTTDYQQTASSSTLSRHISKPDYFFYVFAIIFPAFTGMTAGVGLSGDLKNPRKSIPLGTISATFIGMIVYIFIAYKLSMSASPYDLTGDQLIMRHIALWGPIIPLGLAAATLSSALGSIMVAPRTLQAISMDKIFPIMKMNSWLAHGKEGNNEPVNASLITCIIAFIFVAVGDVNFVAEIITMFFMVTYGAISTISFLQHFGSDPSYRPTFKSRWYLSLMGALMCLYLMLKINTLYALASILIMTLLYLGISYYNKDKTGIAALFEGAIFQLSRRLQVFLQKTERDESTENWRPSVVCVSQDTTKRLAAFELMKLLSYKYGFGTYIHYIEGFFTREKKDEANEAFETLMQSVATDHSNVYVETLISPSLTSAVAQIVQLPGISGKENNMILFEFQRDQPEELKEILKNFSLVSVSGFDLCLLGISERGFGNRKQIHIWITPEDYENASLMILMAYIIVGHPEWKKAVIKIFAVFPDRELHLQKENLAAFIRSGRLPISPKNIELIELKPDMDMESVVNTHSEESDLTLLGLSHDSLSPEGINDFKAYSKVGNILYINTASEKKIW